MGRQVIIRIATATGAMVFMVVLGACIGIYRSHGIALGVVEIISILHAAMGLGFFAGFLIVLVSRVSPRKAKMSGSPADHLTGLK